MEVINILASNENYFTPNVFFDPKTGECLISGESFLENAFKFYGRLTDWIHRYFDAENDSLYLEIKLKYFNTSSSRALLDFFKALSNYQQRGKNIEVIWAYPEPDE